VRVAFVIPWFHGAITGGAEAQCRDAALGLSARGSDVTILTTCIRDHHSDWNINAFPPGEAREDGLRVLRFPADPTDRKRFDGINSRYLAMKASGKYRLPKEEEASFFGGMAPSAALLDYLRRHREDYDFFIFIPYLFFTSLFGPEATGGRSVLLPCLHDEGYAYSRPVARAFASAGAVIFNTEAERALAARILPTLPSRQAVIGDSIALSECRGDGNAFRRKFRLEEPFVLCLGRRDPAKGTDVLISYFRAYRRRRPQPLKLVLAGPDRIDLPRSGDIVDLGYLSPSDKYGALAACACLCNPSLNESFSIVLLEAWANGRPVLVAGGCPPTKELVRRSNGGLWFGSFSEFSAALDLLVTDHGTASDLGRSGSRFTSRHYTAEAVSGRYHSLLTAWKAGGDTPWRDGKEPPGELHEGTPDVRAVMNRLFSNLEELTEPPVAPLSRPEGFTARLRRRLGAFSRRRAKG
jgi:glycosyltransferase involved in cell wall biosynthesis